MFEGIKSFIRETRIKFDYPRFESEQTMAHRAEAERRFDIGQLQREVAQIKDQARLAGDQRFGDEIASIRRKTSELEGDIQSALQNSASPHKHWVCAVSPTAPSPENQFTSH